MFLRQTLRLAKNVRTFSSSTLEQQAAAFSTTATQSQSNTDAAAANMVNQAKEAKKKPSQVDAKNMTDSEVCSALDTGKVKFFNIENDVDDNERAIRIRRMYIAQKTGRDISQLPYEHYDYTKVHGQCCENVIGTMPIPVGVAGPIVIDGKEYYLPMATTEGALVASTTRGCKALSVSGGVTTEVVADGMSRAPVLSTPSVKIANQIKKYLESNFDEVAKEFATTSRFARLKRVACTIAGRKIFIRFTATSGDAMGMNMVGKGVDHTLKTIIEKFPGVSIIALSGNMCTDKKPAAINWIQGRGKSVVAEAIVKAEVVQSVLKTSVDALIDVNYSKNLVGSAMAASVGGFNAHASNVVTAMYLATGQDPAQNVESSNCITLMEKADNGKDLYISVTMPSIECGTVGGGTSLPGQTAMLQLLGVKGSNPERPGANAEQLARIIASGVMAGELSLVSALSSGHLISSHMKLNRKAHPAK